MEVTLEKAAKLVKQHDKDTNVVCHISGNANFEKILETALETLTKNANMYNVSISHPLITFGKFIKNFKLYKYYITNKQIWNKKGLWMVWIPVINSLQFFRSAEQMNHFLNNIFVDNKKFKLFSAEHNISTIDLYTGGFLLTYYNDEQYNGLFDKVKEYNDL